MSERSSASQPGLPGNHRLPTIPTLPPIQIPRSNFHSSLSALDESYSLRIPDSDDSQPISGRRSEESFATARTSLAGANAADSFTAEVVSAKQFIHPSSSLRNIPKSLSVDSFVKEQHRDYAIATPVEPLRSAGSSRSHGRLSFVDPNMERWRPEQLPERHIPPPQPASPGLRAQRHSRYSGPIGNGDAAEDEHDNSTHEDSEFEQGHSESDKVFGRAAEVRRRLMPPKRAGTMPASKASPVPLRARKVPGVSPHQNLANINPSISAAGSSVAPERSPPLRTKVSAPTPLDTARVRLHSIGAQSDDSAVRKAKTSTLLHTETENPHDASLVQSQQKDAILMTLAVIGSRGCGKTSFIRRAWKHSHLTDVERLAVSAKDSDGTRLIHFAVRKAYMQAHENRDYFLTLIEISIQELEHKDGELHDDVWPSSLPKIDGLFALYDASDRSSFIHFDELTSGYHELKIPYIVLACKSDLTHRIPPIDAVNVICKHDGGIVEISNNDAGRDKAKRCVGVLLRGVMRRRFGEVEPHLNPCSPSLYNVPVPWEMVHSPSTANSMSTSASVVSINTPTSATIPAPVYTSSVLPPPQMPLSLPPSFRNINALASSTALPMTPPPLPVNATFSMSKNAPNAPLARFPSAPTSPTRTRSMSDINSDQQKSAQPAKLYQELNSSRSIVNLAKSYGKSMESVKSVSVVGPNHDSEPVAIVLKKDPKQVPPAPWSTVEELLEKLFFLAVSGDDPSFVAHFFLTYRRFTTPRRILLAMQKRMIELNQPSADVALSAFAQLRICFLLEQWVHDYPSDFAVPGTSGALNALIRQILRQTHTLGYGSDFLPFVEMLPTLQDQDSAWAVKAETSIAESDESDSNYEGEAEDTGEKDESSTSPLPHSAMETSAANSSRPLTRERKSSIPLSAKTFLQGTLPASVRITGGQTSNNPPKDSIARLLRASNALLHFDSEDIAREITRRELELYMKIEPRDWLRHTLVSGKKDPNHDRLARFNSSYNDLHDWAASLILCHDKAKSRARVLEKLADVAVKLRNMNNYSGLRAIITAITQSTYPNDEVMEIFKAKTDLHKKYLSSDILMRTAGAHQSYRLALRNTKGPCIPCLEVHTSDLRRAHEGNPDHKADDLSKIHWAKFNMIGKFVSTTTQLQRQCQGQNGYNFPENPQIGQLFDVPILNYDMQQERLGAPPEDDGDMYSTPLPPTTPFDHSGHSRDPGVIKRLFFWS